MTMFNRLSMPPADALHGVMAKYAAEPRKDKIDLGVGVYRDGTGASPIMQAVREAESAHISEQETKSYMSLRGDMVFLSAMQSLAFSDNHSDRIASIQTVGGTGGIRLALTLAQQANPDNCIYIGTPTWPNHLTICEALGIRMEVFPYFDKAKQSLQFEPMLDAVRQARRGDILVLHGPCHNPTGQDLSDSQMWTLLDTANMRGVIPLIDAAYYGLGADLDADLQRLSSIVARVPSVMIVLSCSKAFGLYRERTGVLFVTTQDVENVQLVQKTLERIARATYSMPPAHGAAIVGKILSNPSLSALWREELTSMRQRIMSVRLKLMSASQGDPRLAHVQNQKGIFSLLPINEESVEALAKRHAIYMPASGRINIAGFKTGDIERFCAALKAT